GSWPARRAPPRTAHRTSREYPPFSSSSPLRPVLALRMAARGKRGNTDVTGISLSACCRRTASTRSPDHGIRPSRRGCNLAEGDVWHQDTPQKLKYCLKGYFS